jgi:hypothetical protein
VDSSADKVNNGGRRILLLIHFFFLKYFRQIPRAEVAKEVNKNENS